MFSNALNVFSCNSSYTFSFSLSRFRIATLKSLSSKFTSSQFLLTFFSWALVTFLFLNMSSNLLCERVNHVDDMLWLLLCQWSFILRIVVLFWQGIKFPEFKLQNLYALQCTVPVYLLSAHQGFQWKLETWGALSICHASETICQPTHSAGDRGWKSYWSIMPVYITGWPWTLQEVQARKHWVNTLGLYTAGHTDFAA